MASHDQVPKANSNIFYRNLRDREIRLLYLHPSRDFDAPIYSVLRTAILSDRPVYKALSYVWGDSTSTSTISVNGHDFKATTNLISALRHLRGERAVKVFWVDAVCIDQPNVEERSRQVQLMPDIYKKAEEVVAWLGESGDDSDLAMRLLRRWGTAFAKEDISTEVKIDKHIAALHTNSHAAKLHADKFHAVLEDPFCTRSWIALCHLYKRPYWTRLWVVQEFVLARKVTLVCGFQRADGSDLMVEIFFKKWKESNPKAGLARYADVEPIWDALSDDVVRKKRYLVYDLVKWKTRVGFSSGLSSPQFFKLLFDMSFRECTDPRDYLFGVTGFCTLDTPRIMADYSLDFREASVLFARGCIAQNYLDVLCYAGVGYRRSSPPSPSWAPNWSPGARSRGNSYVPDVYAYPKYSAGGYLSGRAEAVDKKVGSTSIEIYGAVIDTIEEVLDGPTDWSQPKKRERVNSLLEDKERTTYINGMPTLQVYFRTLVADVVPRNGLQRITFSEDYLANDPDLPSVSDASGGFLINFLLEYCLADLPRPEAERLLAQPREEKIAHPSLVGYVFSEDEEPSPSTWAQWIGNAPRHKSHFVWCRYRAASSHSFFTTTKGYMGTGPPYVRPGDKVCVLQGANVPFLLRPDGDGYLLVGEAFVMGLMDGEYKDGFGILELH